MWEGPVTHHENRQKPAYDGTIQDQSLICVICESSEEGNRHAVTRSRLLCACSFLTVSTGRERERERVYKNSNLLYFIYCLYTSRSYRYLEQQNSRRCEDGRPTYQSKPKSICCTDYWIMCLGIFVSSSEVYMLEKGRAAFCKARACTRHVSKVFPKIMRVIVVDQGKSW